MKIESIEDLCECLKDFQELQSAADSEVLKLAKEFEEMWELDYDTYIELDCYPSEQAMQLTTDEVCKFLKIAEYNDLYSRAESYVEDYIESSVQDEQIKYYIDTASFISDYLEMNSEASVLSANESSMVEVDLVTLTKNTVYIYEEE